MKHRPPGTPNTVSLSDMNIIVIAMKELSNQMHEEKGPPLILILMGVPFLHLNDWMTPSSLPAIAIMFMPDRETVFGVPGGRCLGYQGDGIWGTGGRFSGYPRSLSLDTKCKIAGLTESFGRRDQEQTAWLTVPDNILSYDFLRNSPFKNPF